MPEIGISHTEAMILRPWPRNKVVHSSLAMAILALQSLAVPHQGTQDAWTYIPHT